MLSTLSQFAGAAVAVCLAMFFFGDIFLPGEDAFRNAFGDALKPLIATTGILLLLNCMLPNRQR